MTPLGVPEGEDERLRRRERLRHRTSFQRIYDQGKSHPGSLIVLFVLAAPDLERRAGFVAGRRVGGAVSRNRARRLMREAYRRHKSRVAALGFQVVLVARRGCGEAAYGDVERDVIRLLARAGFAPGASPPPSGSQT